MLSLEFDSPAVSRSPWTWRFPIWKSFSRYPHDFLSYLFMFSLKWPLSSEAVPGQPVTNCTPAPHTYSGRALPLLYLLHSILRTVYGFGFSLVCLFCGLVYFLFFGLYVASCNQNISPKRGNRFTAVMVTALSSEDNAWHKLGPGEILTKHNECRDGGSAY